MIQIELCEQSERNSLIVGVWVAADFIGCNHNQVSINVTLKAHSHQLVQTSRKLL